MEIDETIKSVIGELNVPNKDLSLDSFEVTTLEEALFQKANTFAFMGMSLNCLIIK